MSRAEFAMAFAGKTVGWAQEELELTIEEVAQAVGANRKTVSRWREGQSVPSPEHRRHLELFNQLRYLLESSFRTTNAAQRWLHTPVPGLKGRTPLFAMTEGHIEEVVALLATLESGAFV